MGTPSAHMAYLLASTAKLRCGCGTSWHTLVADEDRYRVGTVPCGHCITVCARVCVCALIESLTTALCWHSLQFTNEEAEAQEVDQRVSGLTLVNA